MRTMRIIPTMVWTESRDRFAGFLIRFQRVAQNPCNAPNHAVTNSPAPKTRIAGRAK